MVFNPAFKVEAHITSVCKAANFHARNIGSVRQYLSEEAATQVIRSFMTLRLDYCSAVFVRKKSEVTALSQVCAVMLHN